MRRAALRPIMTNPLSVDRISSRTGLSGDAVAVLMIVAGIIVIVWPEILSLVLGIVLIVLGVLWLYSRFRDRQAASTAPPRIPPGP